MGMFDDVTCHYLLPDGKPPQPFQTKTFDEPYLEHYTITAEGRLLRDKPWWTREKDSPFDPTDTNFHGVLNFYGGDADEWREFDAKFTDGQLMSITEVVS